MESAQEDVSEAELLDLHFDGRKLDLHTAFPAKVESYDAATQTCSCTPQLNRALPDGDGNFITEPLPKLDDVPVVFPRCGKYAITFPLEAGDYVLVVCCERNIGAWRATGNQGDPGDLGTHTLDGAVAVAGLFPDSKASPNASGANMVIGREDDGNARLVIQPHGIDLGDGATKGVIREGDAVNMGSFQLNGAGNAFSAIMWTPPGGGPAINITVSPGVELDGKTKAGSAHVKAVD